MMWSGSIARNAWMVFATTSSGAGARWKPPTTAWTFSTPLSFCAWRKELITPACPQEVITTSPRSFTRYAVAYSPAGARLM